MVTTILEGAAVVCVVAAVFLLAGVAWALLALGAGLGVYAWRLS